MITSYDFVLTWKNIRNMLPHSFLHVNDIIFSKGWIFASNPLSAIAGKAESVQGLYTGFLVQPGQLSM